MRYIFLFIVPLILFSAPIRTKVVEVRGSEAIVEGVEVSIGMSGFIVRTLAKDRASIIASAVVVAFDTNTKKATVRVGEFTLFQNNNLPRGKWKVRKGDMVVLAYAYSRGLLIAPSEKVYYTLTNAMKQEIFVHPDIFATSQSFLGHPTPLQEDFRSFCNNVTIGLVFFYIERRLYTTDCQSMKILDVQEAPLSEDGVKLPFYSRVEKIEANWFGAGSGRLESYAPYYYELLYTNNRDNEKLRRAILDSNDENVSELAEELGLR